MLRLLVTPRRLDKARSSLFSTPIPKDRFPFMTSDDVYRPPSADAPPANHSTFSAEEWRYIGKVFAWWVVGASIVVGVGLTVQTVYALKAFSAAGRTGGIVAVSALRQMAPTVVIFAASSTLVMAIERRTERRLPPPSQELPLLALASFFAALPVVNSIILGVSFATNTVYYDGSAADFWTSIDSTVGMGDFAFGTGLLLILAFLLRVSAPGIVRQLGQFPGLLLLKYFLAAVTCVVVGGNLGNLMANIWFALVAVLG